MLDFDPKALSVRTVIEKFSDLSVAQLKEVIALEEFTRKRPSLLRAARAEVNEREPPKIPGDGPIMGEGEAPVIVMSLPKPEEPKEDLLDEMDWNRLNRFVRMNYVRTDGGKYRKV
jgi:hypothetical protein